MRIVGEWWVCDDAIIRPVIRAYAPGAGGRKQRDRFLVDTGADRSVFSADLFGRLETVDARPPTGLSLSGVGGSMPFVIVQTVLELRRDDGVPVSVRGEFAAFTDPHATDMSILGRDVLDNFDVIISRRRDEVLLLAPSHQHHVSRV